MEESKMLKKLETDRQRAKLIAQRKNENKYLKQRIQEQKLVQKLHGEWLGEERKKCMSNKKDRELQFIKEKHE